MFSYFGNTSAIQHNDLVGATNGAKSVGNDQYGSTTIEIGKVIGYNAFVLSIEGIGCLVKKDVVRLAIDGTGNEDSLLLSFAKAHAFGTYEGVKSQR